MHPGGWCPKGICFCHIHVQGTWESSYVEKEWGWELISGLGALCAFHLTFPTTLYGSSSSHISSPHSFIPAEERNQGGTQNTCSPAASSGKLNQRWRIKEASHPRSPLFSNEHITFWIFVKVFTFVTLRKSSSAGTKQEQSFSLTTGMSVYGTLTVCRDGYTGPLFLLDSQNCSSGASLWFYSSKTISPLLPCTLQGLLQWQMPACSRGLHWPFRENCRLVTDLFSIGTYLSFPQHLLPPRVDCKLLCSTRW